MSAENGKVCSNCRHCKRYYDEGGMCHCKCEVIGKWLSYIRVAEGWCKHWAKDTELNPNKDGVKSELEGEETMKYIIMCGGEYPQWERPKQLKLIDGEMIVERTIRLLRESGVEDIAISTLNDTFEVFGVPLLKHNNTFGHGGEWIEAFYPTTKPACYIFGDVYFSPEAIKTIVETKTDSIEFFASAPPFSESYKRKWAEPFAFKVNDQGYFRECIEEALVLKKYGILHRLISWELWQVIKKTPLNEIDYTNYAAINDYTCDIDYPEDIAALERVLNE